MCSVEGCSRKVRTKGMCASHFAQQWNQANKEKYNSNWMKYYYKNGGARRTHGRDLFKNYGITEEDYAVMFESQGGVCAICGRGETSKSPVNDSIKRLAVDHNHSTGKIRGLLCSTCNNGLGCFKDDKSLMEKAISYLKVSE